MTYSKRARCRYCSLPSTKTDSLVNGYHRSCKDGAVAHVLALKKYLVAPHTAACVALGDEPCEHAR
jgi:hypothetical protein